MHTRTNSVFQKRKKKILSVIHYSLTQLLVKVRALNVHNLVKSNWNLF